MLSWPARTDRTVAAMRSWRTRRVLLLPAVILTLAASCRQITNPTADVELQQSLYDLEDLLVQMRDETALLQQQVDSLGGIVARQDTLLRQVAMRSGIPLP